MSAYLRCLAGPQQGRELLIDPESPLQFELKRKGEPCGWVSFAVVSEGMRFINDSDVKSLVNDEELGDTIINHGDRVRIGPMLFQVHIIVGEETQPGLPSLSLLHGDDATETAEAPEDLASDSAEEGRVNRRISASRMSAVEEPEDDAKSLLSRVGSVFKRSGRDDRPNDLIALEERRDRLLRDVGRVALEHHGAFGLSAQVFAKILRNEHVNIGPGDVAASMLDTFRRNMEMLKFLDAEIIAKRQEHGLQLKTDRLSNPMPLREEREAHEANAFNAMDRVGTEALPGTGTSPIEVGEVGEVGDEDHRPPVPAPTGRRSTQSGTDSDPLKAANRRRGRRRRR